MLLLRNWIDIFTSKKVINLQLHKSVWNNCTFRVERHTRQVWKRQMVRCVSAAVLLTHRAASLLWRNLRRTSLPSRTGFVVRRRDLLALTHTTCLLQRNTEFSYHHHFILATKELMLLFQRARDSMDQQGSICTYIQFSQIQWIKTHDNGINLAKLLRGKYS